MRKYIFTESQFKHVLDDILLEKSALNESHEVYNLSELAEILSRTGYDEDTLLAVLQDVYRAGGDDEVIKLFKASTGIDIESVSKGRYVFRLT